MTENNYQRDERIRSEEARLVRIEEALKRIENGQIEALGTLNEHLPKDDERFSSIDSRLQGIQNQLTTLLEKQAAIIDHEKRIKILEHINDNRSRVWKTIETEWKIIVTTIATTATIIGIILGILNFI